MQRKVKKKMRWQSFNADYFVAICCLPCRRLR